MKFLALLMAAASLGMGLPAKAAADRRKPIGFELFSWKAGSEWRYAVVEGTGTHRSGEAIRSRPNRLKNMTFLKGRLSAIPARETIYWRVAPRRGFVLPPQETVREIKDYAEGLQLRVLAPGDPNIVDPIDNILAQ